MAVYSVLIGLQSSFPDGSQVTAENFLDPLDIGPEEEVEAKRADGGEWASGMVYFPVIRLSDFDEAKEPIEAFYSRVKEVLRTAADFLNQRKTSVISRLKSSGMSLRLFIDVRMDDDQMELDLPPEFLAACGRLGLGIYVISNDIPAGEVLAQRTGAPP